MLHPRVVIRVVFQLQPSGTSRTKSFLINLSEKRPTIITVCCDQAYRDAKDRLFQRCYRDTDFYVVHRGRKTEKLFG